VTHDQREALSMSDKILVMNQGRKQQEGSPEDVYNYPDNHFVADFLGHSNFFKGVVSEQAEDLVHVRLDDGNLFRIAHPGNWKQNDSVEMVVRAQNLKVMPEEMPPPESDMNAFKGTIRDRSYMGGEISYFVELESGTLLHAIGLAKLNPIRKGTAVKVHVAPRHCGLLKQDNPPG
jgi:ABC-type Fe3+/spermidine/putrescine transport system ATPase subunit